MLRASLSGKGAPADSPQSGRLPGAADQHLSRVGTLRRCPQGRTALSEAARGDAEPRPGDGGEAAGDCRVAGGNCAGPRRFSAGVGNGRSGACRCRPACARPTRCGNRGFMPSRPASSKSKDDAEAARQAWSEVESRVRAVLEGAGSRDRSITTRQEAAVGLLSQALIGSGATEGSDRRSRAAAGAANGGRCGSGAQPGPDRGLLCRTGGRRRPAADVGSGDRAAGQRTRRQQHDTSSPGKQRAEEKRRPNTPI